MEMLIKPKAETSIVSTKSSHDPTNSKKSCEEIREASRKALFECLVSMIARYGIRAYVKDARQPLSEYKLLAVTTDSSLTEDEEFCEFIPFNYISGSLSHSLSFERAHFKSHVSLTSPFADHPDKVAVEIVSPILFSKNDRGWTGEVEHV